MNLHNCSFVSQICRNTPGSFICDCKKGFKPIQSPPGCGNINECQLPNPKDPSRLGLCSERADCFDTEGSYYCRCHYPFRTEDDSDPQNPQCEGMT